MFEVMVVVGVVVLAVVITMIYCEIRHFDKSMPKDDEDW